MGMPSLKQMTPDWLKTLARNTVWAYRRATSRSRALPDFLIIGAQKAGTSSLYSYLGQHPQLIPSHVKEVHYFDGGLNPNIDNFEKGEAWYRANFPFRNQMSAGTKSFEASPLYIFNPLAPKRIFDLVPEVKLILMLRNPTERAISQYFHEKRWGNESLPIEEALRQEENRLAPVIDSNDYKNHAFIHHSYKSRGLYKQQIERFLNHFPLEQLLILGSEEFFAQPDSSLKRVFEFVGVDPGFQVNDLVPRNVAKNKGNVSSDVYEQLDDYFLPHNQALYELIGKNYGW